MFCQGKEHSKPSHHTRKSRKRSQSILLLMEKCPRILPRFDNNTLKEGATMQRDITQTGVNRNPTIRDDARQAFIMHYIELVFGRSVNARHRETGETTLIEATRKKDYTSVFVLLEMFPRFMDFGDRDSKNAKIIDVDASDRNGNSALLVAAAIAGSDISKLLLQHGANVEQQNSMGLTPLHLACHRGDLDLVKFLVLDKGANVQQTDELGRTPLFEACYHGHEEVVAFLVDKSEANVDHVDNNNTTALHEACRSGSVGVVKLLLSKGTNVCGAVDDNGKTPFFEACFHDHILIVDILLSKDGSCVNQSNSKNETPLHVACWNGSVKIVELLLKKGRAKTEISDNTGWTPLHVACYRKEEEIVQLFIDSGSNTDM